MTMSIRKFRVLLALAAVALLLIVGGFLGLARQRAHRALRGLPERLGADIQKATNGFTYSQAVGGRTVFTLHAATAVQRRDGSLRLHDVGVVLYGRDQQRADRVYGREFEYDQKAGVVRAAGEVHLDLQAPAPRDAHARAEYAAGGEPGGQVAADPELVHVKTSGLWYSQTTRVASTAEELEFTYHGVSGRARGASYNADTGVMNLLHEVRVSGVRDGRPMLLTAAGAEADRGTRQVLLRQARYVVVGQQGARSDTNDQVTAGTLRLSLGANGGLERAEGKDGVGLETERGVVRAPSGSAEMNTAGRPDFVRLSGGVEYHTQEPLREGWGHASQGAAHFDDHGGLDLARLTGDVALYTRTRTGVAEAWSSEGEMHGSRVDAVLVAGAGGRRVVKQVTAQESARLLLEERGSGAAGATTSEVSADRLMMVLERSATGLRPAELTGGGHTTLRRKLADGSEDRSAGDSLEVRFAPAAAGKRGGVHLAGAVQRGSVVIRHTGAMRGGKVQELDARAKEARFDGSDTLTLAEGAQVSEAGSSLRADRIRLVRGSGDSTAEGGVEAAFVRGGGADVVHVVAQQAVLARGKETATFHGPGSGARLWQGGSQIEAPTLVVNRKIGELSAFGDRASGAAAVHTVLSPAATQRAPTGVGRRAVRARGPEVVRISSGRLTYHETTRRADFTGGVIFEDSNGKVRSEQASATMEREEGGAGRADGRAASSPLTAASPNKLEAAFPTGGLDRVVAGGGVTITQPGREATGDEVMYTAADGVFLLTGAPAVVMDAANGTVRGTEMRFRSGDTAVVVSGQTHDGSAGRVHSEIKVRTE